MDREIRALISSGKPLDKWLNGDIEVIENEIYDIYLNTGYMYHTSNHIEPIPDITAPGMKEYLVRGCALQEPVLMSGLGLYCQSDLKNKHNIATSVNELFQITQMNLTDYIEKLLSYAEWKEFRSSERAEYLRMRPPFTGGYWCRESDNSGTVSLLRIGQPGRYLYFLYKYTNGSMVTAPLAPWMTDEYQYRQIACGILSCENMLPASLYWHDGELTHLHIGYLYPPDIQYFIKLYSWPESMNHFPSDFRRVMTKEIFDTCRSSIEPLGYGFIER